MWYYCRSRDFPSDIAPVFGTGSIATAVSDDGLSWQRIDGPLAGGAVFAPATDAASFDSTHVGTGDIVWINNRWLMVYFGGNHEIPTDAATPYRFPGFRIRLGLAESNDGINWTRIPGNAPAGSIVDAPPGCVYAAFPGIVVDDDGSLFVHYTTIDRDGHRHDTRWLKASGLCNWEEHQSLGVRGLVLPQESAGIITRDIIRSPNGIPGRWLMVYTARDGRPEMLDRRSIRAAISDDLTDWTNYSPNATLSAGRAGAWDETGVAVPRLVATEAEFRLYYYGWSRTEKRGIPSRGIGCAVSQNLSLSNFGRVE